MPMKLQFIDQTAIGPDVRQQIRSHVMIGKNAGKPRPTKKKIPIRTHRKPPSESSGSSSEGTSKELIWPTGSSSDSGSSPEALLQEDVRHTLAVKRILHDDLVLFSFPQRLSPTDRLRLRSWFLIVGERLYPPEVCTEFKIMNSCWVTCVFTDLAYLEILLSIAASFEAAFLGDSKVTEQAMKHLAKAYSLINKRLAKPGRVSDDSLVVVTTLAIYQRVLNQHDVGRVHLAGLHKMIQLRGGLAQLHKDHPTLSIKPWRLDLEFALEDGTPPRFAAREMPGRKYLEEIGPDGPNAFLAERLEPCSQAHPTLIAIMVDIISLCDVLNVRKLAPQKYSETQSLLLHQLLEFSAIGERGQHPALDNLLHLTLVALMTGLLPDYGGAYARYDLLAKRLQSAYLEFHNTPIEDRRSFYAVEAEQDRRLLLWAMFVGGVTVVQHDAPGFLPVLSQLCGELGLSRWPDIRVVISEFAWIRPMYDVKGRGLWEDVLSFNKQIVV